MATSDLYTNLLAQALQGNVNVTGHTLKMALLSGYTPNLAGDVHYADVSAHEVTGPGYTAGGAALSSVALTATAANSWAQTWTAAHAYTAGQLIRPVSPNGYVYRCVTGGTSGGSAPTFPTVLDQTVTDSGVVWSCAGTGVVVLTSNRVTWTGLTVSTTSAALYDSNTGVLIAVQQFGATDAPVAQTYYLAPDAVLGWANWVTA